MKILVLGGSGRMSLCTIRDLLEIDSDEISEVVIAARDFKKVKDRADKLRSEKVSPARVDIADHTSLVKLIEEYDVVLNCAPGTRSNLLGGLKAALDAGVHYIDLGGYIEDMEDQLKLNDKFVDAGLTAVIGLGSMPGISSLMARYIVDRLDSVESIYLSFAYASFAKERPLYWGWDPGQIVNAFIYESTIFRDGRFVKVPPQSGLEEVRFPDPIGVRKIFYIPHPEPYTFSIYFKDKGLKNSHVKAAFIPDFVEKLNFLINLGLASTEPIKVKDLIVEPLEVLKTALSKLPPPPKVEPIDYGCTRLVARGEKSGDKIEYVAEMVNKPYRGLNGTQHRTGHSPSIGARMIMRGDIKRRGVFPPEVGIDPKIFFRELAKRELEIHYRAKYLI